MPSTFQSSPAAAGPEQTRSATKSRPSRKQFAPPEIQKRAGQRGWLWRGLNKASS